MLTSLFGDLGGPKKPDDPPEPGEPGFQATALSQSADTGVNSQGQMVDRLQHDLVVSGSPAQAIREHFATTRADLETADRLITLLDPVGVWGSAVVKALSDAGGRPIERLHLREQTTLRTLATIERTTLVRRHEEMLRIYHADVRAPGPDNAEIPVALMERSHMTTVILGPLQPPVIDALLKALHAATHAPSWRCPHLLFMLPPGGLAINERIKALDWPHGLHLHLLNEPLVSTSSIWNAMLGTWNHVKDETDWDPSRPGSLSAPEFPARVADLEPPPVASLETPSFVNAPAVAERKPLDPQKARAALAELRVIEGLLGAAIVDGQTGLVVVSQEREDAPVNLSLWAAASAQLLRAHRMAARSVGMTERVEEVMSSTGGRQQVLRALTRHPDLFLMAVLDRQPANLAMTRFRLVEIDAQLS